MLEPAVRPGAVSGGGAAQQGKPAFERASFQELLSGAAQTPSEGDGVAAGVKENVNPLGGLGGLGQIENAALRDLLAQARRSDESRG